MSLKILFLCLAAGAACGIADGVVSTVLRRRHVLFTVIADILLAAVLVGSHALVSYFCCDGIFFPYAVIAQIFGFALLRVIASKITAKIVAALSPKISELRKKRDARREERKRRRLKLKQNP